jgi:elongation of very long chain fatty acids protein 4
MASAWRAQIDSVGDDLTHWSAHGTSITNAPTKGWPLASASEAAIVVAGYLGFVLLGSMVMRAIPGDGIKFPAASFAYNIAQMVLCSYMCVEAALLAHKHGYRLVCNDFVEERPPLAPLLWVFYVSKVLDFADTFFIIAGKRWRQLSFLHVYHHATIFSMYWLNLNVNYDGGRPPSHRRSPPSRPERM